MIHRIIILFLSLCAIAVAQPSLTNNNLDNLTPTAKDNLEALGVLTDEAGPDNAAVAAAIAEDPASVRNAAGVAKVFNVKDPEFGAFGDGVILRTGAITATETTLVCTGATFTAADVGKSIIVRGAADVQTDSAANDNPLDLATTIASVTNSTTVELTDAAVTTVSDADVIYGTDDTDAIQDAIDAADAADGGTVFIPAGIYFVDGSAKDVSYSNSILNIPLRLVRVNIAIVGESPGIAGAYSLATPTTDLQRYDGTVLIRSASHTGSIIGGSGEGSGSAAFNFTRCHLIVRNLRVTGTNGAAWKGIDANLINCFTAENVSVDTGCIFSENMAEPPSGSCGIRTPKQYNGAIVNISNVFCQGFETGIQLEEHSNAEGLFVQFCKYGVMIAKSDYLATITSMLSQWCVYDIASTGGNSQATILSYSFERYSTAVHGSRWYENLYGVNDTNNYITGRIYQVSGVFAGGSGTQMGITYTGAKKLLFPTQGNREIDPNAFFPVRCETSGGSLGFNSDTSQVEAFAQGNGFYQIGGAGAGSSFTWSSVYVPSGHIKLSVLGRKSTSSGIVEWTVNGASIGTTDMYDAAGPTRNVLTEYEFDNLTAGYKTIVATVATKNASSSSYLYQWSQIYLHKVN